MNDLVGMEATVTNPARGVDGSEARLLEARSEPESDSAEPAAVRAGGGS